MDVTVVPSDVGTHLLIIRPEGEIDSPAADILDHRIQKALDEGATHIVLDLSAVTYLNSAGLGVIALAAKRTRALSGDVVLASLQGRPRRAIELVRLDQVITITHDTADALTHLASIAASQ